MDLFGLGDESFDFNNSFGQDDDFMSRKHREPGLQDFGDLRDPRICRWTGRPRP